MPIAPPTVPPAGVTDSRYARRRILAYGDSLTAGYYNQGAAFSPYADALRSDLCAFARDASSAGAGADEHSAVAIDVYVI
jgi:lysophospholipase L1-like esterase